VRKREKKRGIKRMNENIFKNVKIIPVAHLREVHYYRN